MKKFLMILTGAVAALILMTPAYADNGQFAPVCDDPNLDPQTKAQVCDTSVTVSGERSLMEAVASIINVALAVIGLVAVIVIVMAGQRYVTSVGDPGKLKAAKDMLMWGIIGLVVALLAFAIVNFIAGAVS